MAKIYVPKEKHELIWMFHGWDQSIPACHCGWRSNCVGIYPNDLKTHWEFEEHLKEVSKK